MDLTWTKDFNEQKLNYNATHLKSIFGNVSTSLHDDYNNAGFVSN